MLNPDFRDQLVAFLQSRRDRAMIDTPQVYVYTRKSHRTLFGRQLSVLDIADITVSVDLRRQGLFKEIFDVFKELATGNGYDGVFVENVHNPYLRAYLMMMAEADTTHYYWDRELKRFFWTEGLI